MYQNILSSKIIKTETIKTFSGLLILKRIRYYLSTFGKGYSFNLIKK